MEDNQLKLYSFKRRKPIDGLRGYFCCLVVLFHLRLFYFSQSYSGVDGFFVISGFVITSIIYIEFLNTKSFSFSNFYAKRSKRLLPSSFVVLFITCILLLIFASDKSINTFKDSFIAACFYFENYYQIIIQSDYFTKGMVNSPVIHYWSLSIEEQFYLFWPLLFIIMITYIPKYIYYILGLFVLSSLYILFTGNWILPVSYYSTQFRLYQLIIGAIISIITINIDKSTYNLSHSYLYWIGNILSYTSFIIFTLISTPIIPLNPILVGLFSTLTTGGMIIGFELHSQSILSNILSSKLFQLLGYYSYEIYLWHYPIIFINKLIVDTNDNILVLYCNIINILVILILSYITKKYIGNPIRFSNIHKYTTIILSILLSFILAFIIILLMQYHIYNITIQYNQDSKTQDYNDMLFVPNFQDKLNENEYLSKYFTLQQHYRDLREPGKPYIVLLGDSHVMEWKNAAYYVAKERNATVHVYTIPSCPWIHNERVEAHEEIIGCCRFNCTLLELALLEMRKDPPDHLGLFSLVNSYREIKPYDNSTNYINTYNEEWFPLFKREVLFTLDWYIKNNIKITIFETHKIASPELIECQQRKNPEECTSSYEPFSKFANPLTIYRDILGNYSNIYFENFEEIICPNETCRAVENDITIFNDKAHITEEFAVSHWKYLNNRIH